MLLNLSFSYQNVKIGRTEKGGFKIVHMHFWNCTKRFFEMQGSDILIRALQFV